MRSPGADVAWSGVGPVLAQTWRRAGFISYRVSTDAETAEDLCYRLLASGLEVSTPLHTPFCVPLEYPVSTP